MEITKEVENEILKTILETTDKNFDDIGINILSTIKTLDQQSISKLSNLFKFIYLQGTKNGVDLSFIYLRNIINNHAYN